MHHRECIATLLQFGARPDLEDLNGDSPLHLALYSGFLPSVEVLATQVREGDGLKRGGRRGEWGAVG